VKVKWKEGPRLSEERGTAEYRTLFGVVEVEIFIDDIDLSAIVDDGMLDWTYY
jgi:hypothetical protein